MTKRTGTPMAPSRRRGVALALSASASLSTLALCEPAQAADEEAIVGVSALVLLAGADIVFTSHDFLVAAKGERPTHGWAVAETIVTAPQAVALNALVAVGSTVAKEEEQVGVGFALIPTICVSTMAIHGSWASDEKANPAVLMWGSLAIGIDMAFSSAAIGRLFDGEWAIRGVALAEVLLTAPQVGLGVYAAAKDASERGSWIALTAWSGVLLLHGAASLVYDASERAWGHRALAPAPFRLSPTVVGGLPGRAGAPAIAASGAF